MHSHNTPAGDSLFDTPVLLDLFIFEHSVLNILHQVFVKYEILAH